MGQYVQEIKRTTWGQGFLAPRPCILRREDLEENKPSMTKEEFIRDCRDRTVGMIHNNVEVITDIEDGWSYVVFDPTNMSFIHITLRIYDIEIPY